MMFIREQILDPVSHITPLQKPYKINVTAQTDHKMQENLCSPKISVNGCPVLTSLIQAKHMTSFSNHFLSTIRTVMKANAHGGCAWQ